MATGDDAELTDLLRRWRDGDADALALVMQQVYSTLRRLAQRLLAGERADHTLQPTALINEAYLRLVGDTPVDWRDRRHFVALAARAMREVLVDHARQRQAAKRPTSQQRVSLADVESVAAAEDGGIDVLRIDQALRRLQTLDTRQAQIVELRFFGGLNLMEIEETLGISRATITREWRMARGFLKRELAVAD